MSKPLPKIILFDVDGTLWRGGKVFPGVIGAIDQIRTMGIREMIVTNNSSRTREEFAQSFATLGLKGFRKNDIFSACYACAIRMKRDGVHTAYISGIRGLIKECDLAGIKVYTDATSIEDIPKVDAIAVCRTVEFGFDQLSKIATLYQRDKCRIYGANPDHQDVCGKVLLCGGGAFVNTAAAICGQTAINLGKPTSETFEILIEKTKLKPEEMMMVGDRVPTDVLFAKKHGMECVFVLSGDDRKEQALSLEKELQPDYIINSVADLPELLRSRISDLKPKAPNAKKPKGINKENPKKKTASTNPKKKIIK